MLVDLQPTTGLLNFADLARNGGLAQSTLKRYLALLEAAFLVRTLPAWFVNVGKRFAKAPKALLTDTGLAAYLIGANASRIASARNLLGPLLENFVAMELLKQASWSRARPRVFHFRTSQGRKVDLVMEDGSGRVVGVEVKAASTVDAGDLKGLRELAEAAGRRFVRGIVLYGGAQVVPFARNLHAAPVHALWGGR